VEKSSWTDRARNEEVLHRVKEQRNIVRTVQRGMLKELVALRCLMPCGEELKTFYILHVHVSTV